MGHPGLDIEIGVVVTNEKDIQIFATSPDRLPNLSEIGPLWRP